MEEDSGKLDIYNRKETYEKTLQTLAETEICPENKQLILEFIEEYCEGLSYSRKAKYVARYNWFARLLGKSFLEAAREDIRRLEDAIETKPVEMYVNKTRKWRLYKDKCTPTTIADNKKLLRLLYKWIEYSYKKNKKIDRYKGSKLRAVLKRKQAPELVADVIDDTHFERKLKSKDMLTWEEVVQLSQATTCARDKAIIQVLGETGLRASELLTLQIGDYNIKEMVGKVVGEIHVRQSKTGEKKGLRSIGIVNSVPALVEYLRNHPLKKDKSAPLWLGYGDKYHNLDLSNPQPVSPACLRKILFNAAKKTGIKKKVNPHHLRKSRASLLAHLLKEQEVKNYMGWTATSTALNSYMFLDEQITNENYWRSQGVDIENGNPKPIEELKPVKCECGVVNPAGEYFCVECNRVLGEKSSSLRRLEELIQSIVEKRIEDTNNSLTN